MKSDHSFPGHTEPSTASTKKRKLNIQRVSTWKIIASGIKPPAKRSSSSNMQSEASTADLVSIVSELFSPDGISRVKFDSLFFLCNQCARVLHHRNRIHFREL
jgi:hypothetical protein